jgi:hypothetical protein
MRVQHYVTHPKIQREQFAPEDGPPRRLVVVADGETVYGAGLEVSEACRDGRYTIMAILDPVVTPSPREILRGRQPHNRQTLRQQTCPLVQATVDEIHTVGSGDPEGYHFVCPLMAFNRSYDAI